MNTLTDYVAESEECRYISYCTLSATYCSSHTHHYTTICNLFLEQYSLCKVSSDLFAHVFCSSLLIELVKQMNKQCHLEFSMRMKKQVPVNLLCILQPAVSLGDSR